MMFHLDIQTVLILIPVSLLIGILIGANLARPRSSSRSSDWRE